MESLGIIKPIDASKVWQMRERINSTMKFGLPIELTDEFFGFLNNSFIESDDKFPTLGIPIKNMVGDKRAKKLILRGCSNLLNLWKPSLSEKEHYNATMFLAWYVSSHLVYTQHTKNQSNKQAVTEKHTNTKTNENKRNK